MLRSGSASAPARFALHAFAIASIVLFVYMVTYVVRVAVRADHVGVTSLMTVIAVASVGAVVSSAVYVSRSAHSGGYALLALAALASTFLCFIGLVLVLAF